MKATVIGNVGRDGEVKTAESGNRLVFSVAESVGWGENKKTQWVAVTLFGKRGDSLAKYIVKGQKVVVFGEVSVREYQDKNGVGKFSIDCVASDVVLVGGKKEEEGAPVSNEEVPF